MKTLKDQIEEENDKINPIITTFGIQLNGINSGRRSEFYYAANFAIPLAKEEGFRAVVDYLMNNAVTYCTCERDGRDDLWCDKHAQTFSAGLLEQEGIRLGILPLDAGRDGES